jgi:hypothetical protein
MRSATLLIFPVLLIAGCVSPLGTIDSTTLSDITHNMEKFDGKELNLMGRYVYNTGGANDLLIEDMSGYKITLLGDSCRRQDNATLLGLNEDTVKIRGVVSCDAEAVRCEVSCTADIASATKTGSGFEGLVSK